jgi:hypothetical protein
MLGCDFSGCRITMNVDALSIPQSGTSRGGILCSVRVVPFLIKNTKLIVCSVAQRYLSYETKAENIFVAILPMQR